MKIYVDGSCKGTGYGGFGVVILNDDNKIIKTYSKMSNYKTTNNEQEMLAILYCLVKYGLQDPVVEVYSDSSYAINTFNDWMFKWERKGWLTASNKTPENLDIVKFYLKLIRKGYKIKLKKVKGHNGILGNELADKLAKGEMK